MSRQNKLLTRQLKQASKKNVQKTLNSDPVSEKKELGVSHPVSEMMTVNFCMNSPYSVILKFQNFEFYKITVRIFDYSIEFSIRIRLDFDENWTLLVAYELNKGNY